MQTITRSHLIAISLAIFSMLFGAGNLVYPIKVGISSGMNTMYGVIGFIVTAICLPLLGLITMILFDGNYESFFGRLGTQTGKAVIFICMLIMGPIIAIPRIITLSHIMTAPFIPITALQEINPFSSLIFALIFLGITYLATFRENRIVDLLGYVISPALLISLCIIIGKGLISKDTMIVNYESHWKVFTRGFLIGYETLDLLGTIFFCSIVLHILKNTLGGSLGYNPKRLAIIGFKAGTIGVSLLALVYTGMGYLAAYHGTELKNAGGSLFRLLAFKILGNTGALIIATAVLMACLSTSIALAAVTAEYFQLRIVKRRYSYEWCLAIVLAACIPLSTFGFDYVLSLTGGPLVFVGYPCLIMLTFCNFLYKTTGFKPVKIPVLATFIIAIIGYFQFVI